MPLPTHIGFQFSEEWLFNALQGEVPAGYQLSRRRTEYLHRRWDLVYKTLRPSEKATLESLWVTSRGAAGAFSLSHPTLGAVVVRFASESLIFQRRSAGLFSCVVPIELEGPQ